MIRLPFHFLIFLLLLSHSACIFRPAIDEHGVVTVRKAHKMARVQANWQFNQIKNSKAISHDPRFTEPVARVAKRLQSVINLPDAKWEFVIFKDKSPNAFALPGGKVGINTGLFQIANSDPLLAAVLGHEISHATSNHAEQRMIHAIGTVALAAVFWAVMDHNDVDHPEYPLTAYAIAAYLLDSLPLARNQEFESDKIGAIYMAKAGYDPHEAVELWKKLDRYHRKKGNRPTPEYFRTHPHDSSRIQALEAFMPVAMRYYQREKPIPPTQK